MKKIKNKAFTLAEDATHIVSKLTKAKGFTLAEVLITLGIIGIVAAMTIPTLIANTKSQQYRSQFKKTLSTLNQAARMAQAQYDFDFATLSGPYSNEADCGAENPYTERTMCALLNGTLSGANYMGNTSESITRAIEVILVSDIAPSMIFASDYIYYSLLDGADIIIPTEYSNSMLACTTNGNSLTSDLLVNFAGIEHVALNPSLGSHSPMVEIAVPGLKQCIGFIDVNGKSKPNKEVTCASADSNTTTDPSNPCTVDNTSMGDIFPVVFHDGTVEPATNAAAYVLNTAK